MPLIYEGRETQSHAAQLSMAMREEQDPLETVPNPKAYAGRQLAQFAAANSAAVRATLRSIGDASGSDSRMVLVNSAIWHGGTVPSNLGIAGASGANRPAAAHAG